MYASILQITAINSTNAANEMIALNALYTQYKQQLPNVSAMDTFLSSHQMAIAQLALASCSARVDLDAALPIGDANRALYTNVDFTEAAQTAFNDNTKRGFAINPISNRVLLNNLSSQPSQTEVYDLLGSPVAQSLTTASNAYTYDSLISKMTNINTPERTLQIVKSLCAAIVGSAVTIVQ